MRAANVISIGDRLVGEGIPALIIAELSANHGQRLQTALEMVDVFADSGADAIKLQTYTPNTLTIDSDLEWFKIRGGLWDGKTLYDLYGEAYTPWEWHAAIMEKAKSRGLLCFSTPFDQTALTFLESLDVPAHKVASFENTDHPLLRRIAACGKPVVMSTGMASLDELTESVQVLRSAGCSQLVLLKCTSAYPATLDEANLATIPDLAERFGVVVGLSDHTMGHLAPVVAVALGAKVIEKHVILDRSMGGPDSSFSMEPSEFADMVRAVRDAERSLGTACYDRTSGEKQNVVFRRSVFVVSDMVKGEAFTPENLRVIRPGYGLPPKEYENLIGSNAACDIPAGTPMNWDLVSGNTSGDEQ